MAEQELENEKIETLGTFASAYAARRKELEAKYALKAAYPVHIYKEAMRVQMSTEEWEAWQQELPHHIVTKAEILALLTEQMCILQESILYSNIDTTIFKLILQMFERLHARLRKQCFMRILEPWWCYYLEHDEFGIRVYLENVRPERFREKGTVKVSGD